MRAIYYNSIDVDAKTITLSGSEGHHLVNVVRVKNGEEILVLDGMGKKAWCKIFEIKKKEVSLDIIKLEVSSKRKNLALGISYPKKDAFESILKICMELGISDIHGVKSEYSQFSYRPSDRFERVLVNALIQSNNPFLSEITHHQSFLNFMEKLKSFDRVYYFCSHEDLNLEKNLKFSDQSDDIFIIGPEGGFSKEEEQIFLGLENLMPIHFDTYILRAPTAVSTAFGYLLEKRTRV